MYGFAGKTMKQRSVMPGQPQKLMLTSSMAGGCTTYVCMSVCGMDVCTVSGTYCGSCCQGIVTLDCVPEEVQPANSQPSAMQDGFLEPLDDDNDDDDE